MTVDASSPLRTDYLGTTYCFCNPGCRTKFQADPSRYLAPPAQSPSSNTPDAGAIYTCPMHPEVRQRGPGACPFCGMALEPAMVTLDEGPNVELSDMTRRFQVATVLGLPVMAFAMAEMMAPDAVHRAVNPQLAGWIQLLLATPVVLWAGWPFFTRAWDSLVNRSPNMFTLIGLGVGAAYAYSVAATAAPGIFPDGFRTHGRVEPYFDTAVVVTALVLLGQVLEMRARSRTSAALKGLLGLTPKTARRGPRLAHALVSSVAVLIIACPCALGLATPMAIMAGTGRGASEGVLVKHAEALERLERVDTIVVDKTGTLTEGRPELVAIETFGLPARHEDAVLRLAAALEQGSEHPLASAIVRAAKARGLRLPADATFASTTGEGAPRRNATSSATCRRVARSSRWPATASTTHPRSPRPRSASRWARAPTWRWRAPASRSSPATCGRSYAPAG